jgi:ABC-type antimicrobial peptide transport system permease subunit
MLGLYGVMAQGVARRTREIGIRMELGAALGRILSMIIGEVALVLTAGLGFKFPTALACSRLISSQLFGVDAHNAAIPVAAAAALCITAALAAYWPARRASQVDPLDALHYQ